MTTISDLATAGGVVRREDVGYDEARRVYNAMIDRHPMAIVSCRTVGDVRAVLAEARRSGLPVAVRGGGHSGPGFGVVDDGLVIDLSPMAAVEVDAAGRTARVQGGATVRELDAATGAHGLATPAGVVGSTGIGGLTLGGGHGYLSRKYGLTIDNLLSAEVVLADGRVVTASEDEHPDLFWAIRGGGGNFGIVTSFTLRLHPVSDVFCGPTAWPAAATADVLQWYRDFLPAQHEDLYGFFVTMTVPPVAPFPEPFHLHKACAIVWCYTGDPDDAADAVAPVRELQPAWDGTGVAPYPALQGMFDALLPSGLQWYWRGDLFREIPDAAVEAHSRFGDEAPTPLSQMHIYPVDGAVHRVGSDETAWGHRDVNFSQVIVGVDPDPSNAPVITKWAKDYHDAVHPYSVGGAYVNFMMDEGRDRVQASYGANYDRLVEIKNTYDPDNTFRINQNIRPTAASGQV